MGQLVYEENLHVYWLPTVPAVLAAPTMTEIDAGEDITNLIPKDGFAPGVSDNRVPTGHLGTSFDGETIGSWGSQLSITFFKDDETDTAWDLFPRGTEGAIVAVPFAAAAALETAYVWHVEAGADQIGNSAANERQTFVKTFAVNDAELRATIAGP